MIGMSTILSIRRRCADGDSVAEIAREEGVSEPTVRKYRDMEDFSPQPAKRRKPRPSKLDPYKATIDSWLVEDRKRRAKQRHTATRIFDRLVAECGYDGGYTTVQKYVKERKARLKSANGQFLNLEWAPGEAQVDFGVCDFRVLGVVREVHYLVVTFPFSNVSLAQCFWGETSECVCEGLKAVFEFCGGVPLRLVFDNATGVGRRVGERVSTADTFERFAAHYGFEFAFCNPASGNEKGAVENAVGAIRRNLFVPMPRIDNLRAYNKKLLGKCMDRAGKAHYLKGEPESQLFMEDAVAMADLPAKPFRAASVGTAKTDKYGDAVIDGRHPLPAGARARPAPRHRRARGVRGVVLRSRRIADSDVRAGLRRRADQGERPRVPAGAALPQAGRLAQQRRAGVDPGIAVARDGRHGQGRPRRHAQDDAGRELVFGLRRDGARHGRPVGRRRAQRGRRRALGRVHRRRTRIDILRRCARPGNIRRGIRQGGVMEADQMTRGQLEAEFSALARTMYFTGSTVAAFAKGATRGQLAAVCDLIRSENATREENRKARLLKRAKFPAVKSVEGFDFSEVSMPDGYTVDDMLSLGFVEAAQDFVFYGGCGRGKTHLSIALGVLATERGYRVRYFETASLVLALKAAAADNRLESALRDIAKADLLIIDEYGYIPIDIEGARLLYRVMSATYEARSMIVTTNIEFGKWGTVLGDAHLATATVDRIMHHGRLVEFGGQSRRFEEALMMGRSEG